MKGEGRGYGELERLGFVFFFSVFVLVRIFCFVYRLDFFRFFVESFEFCSLDLNFLIFLSCVVVNGVR